MNDDMPDDALIPDAAALPVLYISDTRPPDEQPALVYLAAKPSENSRRGLRNSLNLITDLLMPGAFTPPGKHAPQADREQYASRFLYVEWWKLRYQHVAAVRAGLMHRYAPATVNHALSALRGVLKECWRLGLITAEAYHKAVDIQNIKAHILPAGRDLASRELAALARACANDTTLWGVRDGAILALLAVCGLRRAELTALDRFDFNDEDKITVHGGKGRKDRTVYIAGGALLALNDWINVRGDKAGRMFNPITQSGKILIKRGMTEQAVYKLLHKRAEEAGVRDFSPHDLRRTVAGDLLDAGVDIVTVANILGHADVNTTRRYDRRPEDTKRVAAGKLNYTYQKRRKAKDDDPTDAP
ncbi:MAG: site-specific integrase [bacterium]|nr:site-specific integrase [bacterium]